MFLPNGKPYAFLIQSDVIEMTTLIAPAGFLSAINKMNEPALAMTLPPQDGYTYRTIDLTRTMEIFEQYGVHILSRGEVLAQMPEFPVS